jgi:hypothetical protein
MVTPVKKQKAGPGSGGRSRHVIANGMMEEWTRSAIALIGSLYDYNPDDLVLSKGQGVRIYQDMVRDPYVKAAVNLKKMSVSRLPADILPASDSEEDVDIAKFVEWTLENMRTSLDEMLWGVMDCVNCGYSIGEMNYKVIEAGDWKGKIGLDSVKSKDPYVFTFRLDDFGGVAKVIQRIGGIYSSSGGPSPYGSGSLFGMEEFDPNKFLIATFQPLYANPYGSSDLRAGYRAFFIKDWAWKFRAIYMEKFGMPPIIGRFPNGTDEARRKQLEDVLDSIQNETVLTIPEDLQIEILRIATEGRSTEYERAIQDLNKEILIGVMGSFLWAEEGKRTGARAQGQVHFKVSKLFVEHLAKMIEETINRQVVRRIVDMNYDVTNYPKWRFEMSRAEELILELEMDGKLKEQGVSLDPDYYYRKYGRPKPAVTDEIQPLGMDPNEQLDGLPDPSQQQPDPNADPAADNKMDPAFEPMRQESLPEDPQKIGKLREFYEVMSKIHAFRTGIRLFSEPAKIGFLMAGKERAYRQTTKGQWLPAKTAWGLFLQAVKSGR